MIFNEFRSHFQDEAVSSLQQSSFPLIKGREWKKEKNTMYDHIASSGSNYWANKRYNEH